MNRQQFAFTSVKKTLKLQKQLLDIVEMLIKNIEKEIAIAKQKREIQ